MFGFFNKATDPVCKMKVDKNKAKYSSEYKRSLKFSDENYKGEKFLDPKDRKLVHFCSENCKSQFDASPKDYVEKNKTSSCCQNQTQASANKPCC